MFQPLSPFAKAQKRVMGQQSNWLNNRIKRENSDVLRFQYKVTILFHVKLKIFTGLCGQVANIASLLNYIFRD